LTLCILAGRATTLTCPKREPAIGTLVVWYRVGVPVAPPRSLEGLVLIVNGLDFELLQQCLDRHGENLCFVQCPRRKQQNEKNVLNTERAVQHTDICLASAESQASFHRVSPYQPSNPRNSCAGRKSPCFSRLEYAKVRSKCRGLIHLITI
jgi:hypothetical protein